MTLQSRQKTLYSNYLVRKVNTNLTQVVHRIRLRKYVPPAQPVDICISNHTQFDADTSDPDTLEPSLFDMDKIDEDSDLITQSNRSDPIATEPQTTREQTNWLNIHGHPIEEQTIQTVPTAHYIGGGGITSPST